MGGKPKQASAILAIDFDGTLSDHRYPDIGQPVPEAFKWLKRFQELGARLILWTMRDGKELEEAVEWCRKNGVEFWSENANPEQDWSTSPKCYAHHYIDDAAIGCPMIKLEGFSRPCVDWTQIGPLVEAVLLAK